MHLKNFESTNKKRNRNGGSALSSRSVQICSCRSTDGEKEYISNETATILQLWNIIRKILQTKIKSKNKVLVKQNETLKIKQLWNTIRKIATWNETKRNYKNQTNLKHKEKDKLKQNETPKIEQPRNTTRKNLVEKKLKCTINFYFQTELL